ncbi:GDP-mannose 4,6-dehydratase [Ferruginibacter yonginensis]|uniref:GDP-mannose 4,6-dehydratase n=1 Tax=Ferruginibacter yonginensis TaxID=1310416 RepID=A0ABV8QQM9_9BACT
MKDNIMKAIILGAAGQDGIYLTQLLESLNINVVGISRSAGYVNIDITSFDPIKNLLVNEKPNYIFHFAANSSTNHAFVLENYNSIVTSTMVLLEVVYQYLPKTKVFISGSGLQFLNKGIPIKETDDFYANDAYSLCRIQSVEAARYYRSLGLKVYVGYFFNHDSPLRTERHVTKMICENVKKIKLGIISTLTIGDKSVVKEWAFAGDIVNALWLFMNQDAVYEANLSNGEGYSIEAFINECFKIVDVDLTNRIVIDDKFKSSYKVLVSDNSTIKKIGYKPEISFKKLAKLMMQ